MRRAAAAAAFAVSSVVAAGAAVLAGAGLAAPPASGEAGAAHYGNAPAELVPFRRAEPYERYFLALQPFLGPGREETPAVSSLRIGVLAPAPTGVDAARGTMMRRGIDLAVEEANASRKEGELPFETVVREDAPLWGSAANIMVDLATRDAVLAVVGTIDSNATHVALRVGLKAEVVMVNTGSSDPTVTETNIPWILRTWPDDRQHGYRLAQIVAKERGCRRIVVLRSNDRYGRTGIKIFSDSVRRLGVPVVQEMRFLPGDRTFDTQVARLKAAAPDAVVFWGEASDVGRAAAALRSAGVTAPFFGPDRLEDAVFLREAGPAAEGTTITVPIAPDRSAPSWRAFEARFRERWKAAPDAYAAHAYDGTRILLDAVRTAGPNRFRIRDSLYALKSWDGVSGTLRFDPTANNVAPLHVVHVQGGAFVPGAAARAK